jgi:hypothetical protein
MLSQVGFILLAPETIEKLQAGKPLTPEEQQAVDRVPALAEQPIRSASCNEPKGSLQRRALRRRFDARIALALPTTPTRHALAARAKFSAGYLSSGPCT